MIPLVSIGVKKSSSSPSESASSSRSPANDSLAHSAKKKTERLRGWDLLPSGTVLRVWWAGNEDYFECTILDWSVDIDAETGKVRYMHRCDYDGGVFVHDLSDVQYEVVRAPSTRTPGGTIRLTPRHERVSSVVSVAAFDDAENVHPNIAGRKWLEKEEALSLLGALSKPTVRATPRQPKTFTVTARRRSSTQRPAEETGQQVFRCAILA